MKNVTEWEMDSQIDNSYMRYYEREAFIYVFGNGGSAATASHFVCDFNKGICEKREKKFKLVCLNDNVSLVTATANDISYEDIFYFRLVNRLKSDDIGGNSGGRQREKADYHPHVDVDDMQITEDIHMMFDHIMYQILTEK